MSRTLILAVALATASLSAADAPDVPRLRATVDTAVARCAEWLGRPPRPVVVSGGHVGATAIRHAWLSSPATMEIESQAAFAVARSWWPHHADDADTLADAAAWYLQSRLVEMLHDQEYYRAAYAPEWVEWAGGVRWTFPLLPRSRWTAGVWRNAWLPPPRAGRRWLGGQDVVPQGVDSRMARGAAAFATLERWLGWPALQAALAAWAERAVHEALTRDDVVATIGAAAGQDLTWFFDVAFDPAQVVDYRLADVSSAAGPAACGAACIETRVTVRREGTAFTGASRERLGGFDSGDAIEVLVEFADGRRATARWDGRERARTFVFESAAAARAVTLDPSRVLVIDRSYLDNTWRAPGTASVLAGRWIAAWLVWLQNAMLTGSGLV